MSLAADPVSFHKLQRSVFELFHEYLSGYFDGSPHAVGSLAPVEFPNAVLKFQQSSLPQPLDNAAAGDPGVGITMVWINPAQQRACLDNVGVSESDWVSESPATWQFWVRATKNDSEGNAALWAQKTSDLLYALLLNRAAIQPLHAKGVLHVRPAAPILVSHSAKQANYQLRLVNCRATLRYRQFV